MNELIKLIDEYQKGKESNFKIILKLVEKKFQRIKRTADEDAYQDLFLILPKKLRNIDIHSLEDFNFEHTKNYLGKIIENSIKDINKKSNRYYIKNYLVGENIVKYEREFKENIFEEIELKDLLEEILNEKEKYIIEKKYLYDFSIKEIADELNLSRQRINTIKNIALKKLKQEYIDKNLLN